MKLAAHVADWIDEAAAWWVRELGPVGSELVLPTDAYFSDPAPQALFERVVELADMADWTFELVDESDAIMDDPMPNMPRPAVPGVVLAEETEEELPEGGPYPVHYAEEDTREPMVLVASFARQLSHYLLYAASEDVPGGDDHRPALADVGAVLLGFGVFLANTAVRFQQFDNAGIIGWSAAVDGTLGEDALGYALALFIELADADPKLATEYLAANPRAALKWARTQLQGPRADTLARLRAITPSASHAGPYR